MVRPAGYSFACGIAAAIAARHEQAPGAPITIQFNYGFHRLGSMCTVS